MAERLRRLVAATLDRCDLTKEARDPLRPADRLAPLDRVAVLEEGGVQVPESPQGISHGLGQDAPGHRIQTGGIDFSQDGQQLRGGHGVWQAGTARGEILSKPLRVPGLDEMEQTLEAVVTLG